MFSDFTKFNFATAGHELEAQMKEVLPSTWIVAHASKAQTKLTKVALTWEQLDFSDSLDTQKLPVGWAGVTFALALSVPETDNLKAMDRAMTELPALLRALDAHPALYWDSGEQRKLDTGELAFLIPIAVLATYNED